MGNKKEATHSLIKLEGFTRIQIEENGKVVGDTGMIGPNQITNPGISDYVVNLLGDNAGSKQIGFVALGTGTTPAASATSLPGEISDGTQRKAVTFANVASTTARFTATFASSDSFLAAEATIQNVGLFELSSANALFAGKTYTASSCNTDQNVNVTYEIRFTAT